MFEDKTDLHPPRAARVYSLLGAVFFDAFIASNDGKFAVLVLTAAPARFRHHTAHSRASVPELSIQSLHAFYRAMRDVGVPFPHPGGVHPQGWQGGRRFQNLG